MNRFAIFNFGFAIWRKLILRTVLLLAANSLPAAPLRVTTWNLEPSLAAGTNGASTTYRHDLIQDAAEVLNKLHPDVIVLQGVPDWPTCNELLKSLKAAKYNVAAWSSFRDAGTGMLSAQQTAILSKGKAYISWTEAWKHDGKTALGGFAFAAIKTGGRNVGLFSAQLGDNTMLGPDGRGDAQQSAREDSARQLLAQIDSLKNWTANRIQALVVAGDFNTSLDEPMLAREKTLPQLEQAGLSNAFGELPLPKRITVPGAGHSDATADYIFTRDVKPMTPPEIVPTALTQHYPVTCDLDLETQTSPPAPAPAPAQVAQVTKPEPRAAKTPPVQSKETTNVPPAAPATTTVIAGKNDSWRIAGIAAGGVLLLALVWKLTRRHQIEPRTQVLLTTRAGAGTSGSGSVTPGRIVIAPRSADTAGSAADHPPIVRMEGPDSAQAQLWQQRAEEAERRAERATAVVRHGLMAHLSEWLKGRIVQRLAWDRAQLLQTQQLAAQKMQVVDERLAKIESQLQERNRVYEGRIEDLEKELSEAREENRELIRAKIAQVKAEMEKDRADAARRARDKQP
jgi:endonuclease/exonuclease/phosphatase family metal-dependent hydrolase